MMEQYYPSMIPKHCEVCKKTDRLLRCGGCQTYYYCGRDHQVADRPTHKKTCKTIKDSKVKTQEEEAKLRARSGGDDELPPNLLDEQPGRLWLWTPARPYLHAKFIQGEMLIRSWRQQGIEDALALYLDILRQNASDNQGARYVIPSLYLRLGRNQEAYDFLKGWGLKYHDKPEAMQPEEPLLAYQHVKNADATEGVDLWTDQFLELSMVSSIQLIKVRLLIGLQFLLEFREGIPPGTPMPTARQILAGEPGKYCEDILDRMPQVFADDDSIKKKMDEINEQLQALFTAVTKYNKHFWPLMLHPTEADFQTGPQIYTFGSRQEAHLAFMYTYSAWCETPMAMEMVRATTKES